MKNENKIKTIMQEHPEKRDKLYARGFLFTDDKVNDKQYPFYNIWKRAEIGKYVLLVAAEQQYYIYDNNNLFFILIGHAYNPFSMSYDEKEILSVLAEQQYLSDGFWDKFNQLTGIFTLIMVRDNEIYVVGDPTCMQSVYYGQVNNHIYISSHTNLLGSLLNLEVDSYIERLRNYRFFSMLGNSLPGNLSQFKDIYRLIPNHYLYIEGMEKIRVKRFYWPISLQIKEKKLLDDIISIMKANMLLISQKWKKPAISMTGGCDSKTTLACTEGLYDKFSYFSYISSESEKVDAEAAHTICEKIGLTHKIYTIPEDDTSYPNIEQVRTILEWNTGDIIPVNKNDVRKRAFFAERNDFDVEVKSWVSEIGRAYYSKRFNGRKNFDTMPTPRKCTTLYKFFLHNRKLVRETDEVFKEYLNNYFEQAGENPVAWQEQFFWEFRMASWNGGVITGEHKYSFDITIPYNNRKLLELLISVSLEERINDSVYRKIRTQLNPAIDETGIFITNLKHTKRREKLEDLYYFMHSNFKF